MPELQSARQKFPEVKQGGAGWCIPAAIEVALRYFGAGAINQEEMVYCYYQKFGAGAFCTTLRQGIQFTSTDKATIIEAARQLLLSEANFDVFAEIARELTAAAHQPIEFTHPPDPANFPGHMKSSVDCGDAFLMACGLPNNDCHILAVVGYHDDLIDAYDPATGQTDTKTAAQFCVNQDCLIIRKVLTGR